VAGLGLAAAPKRRGIPIKRSTKRPVASDTLASFEEPLALAPEAPVTDTDVILVEEALSVDDEDDAADIPSAKTSMSPPSAGAQEASLALADTTKQKGVRVKLPKKKTLTT
jgi:hypothetical protein